MNTNEGVLIRSCLKGSQQAYNQFYELYRKLVYYTALQLLGNKEDALDMSQHTFIKVFNALPGFDHKRPLKPWILQILRNQCIDFLRTRKGVVSLEQAPTIGDTSMDPEVLSEQSEFQKKLWKSLEKLSYNHREVIVLKSFQGLSYQQISEVLEIPVGTVMSRLNAARNRLKIMMEEGE